MEIKFDEMVVDISLAKKYLSEEEELLKLYNNYDSFVEKSSSCIYNGQEIIYNSNKRLYRRISTFSETELIQKFDENVLFKKLRDLASHLKQNAKLIAQLEYHIRSVPIEDTAAQLNLIIQYFMLFTPSGGHKDGDKGEDIVSNEPLVAFGIIKEVLYVPGIVLNVNKATAPIAHLFVKLCSKVGLPVSVLFKNKFEPAKIRSALEDFNSGTVAVVSNDADIDSAVDTFLASSKTAPWRLRRILVQESVYPQFKDALTWKCNLKSQGDKTITTNHLCADTLTYNGQVFLLDPLDPDIPHSAVTIEAYRTSKEMNSLVQKDEARYLSLWSNGIAEINEVAYSTKSPIVWVNTIADFRGPPQVIEAFYSYTFNLGFDIKKCEKIEQLCVLAQSWAKLDFETRREILLDFLGMYKKSDPANNAKYINIIKSISESTMPSFVDIGKDYVSVCTSYPLGIEGAFTDQSFFNVNFFKSLLYGNALALFDSEVRLESDVDYDLLKESGLPVIYIGEVCEGDFTMYTLPNLHLKTRAVWTNSGTIFAN